MVTAYALAFGSLLLVGGRLGDMFSRKRVFITGLIGFALSSALGGAAASFGMLVAARTLQGAFGAILAPAALGTLVSTFRDPRERGRAFGVFGSVAGGGGAVGLILGGVLTEYASWRWTLYVNLFFAAVAVAGALIYMESNRPGTRPRMDWAGAVLASSRPVPDRLRVFPRGDGGLGRRPDHRLARRRGGPAGRVRVRRAAGSATRCCRCGWSWTGPGAAPTSRSG